MHIVSVLLVLTINAEDVTHTLVVHMVYFLKAYVKGEKTYRTTFFFRIYRSQKFKYHKVVCHF